MTTEIPSKNFSTFLSAMCVLLLLLLTYNLLMLFNIQHLVCASHSICSVLFLLFLLPLIHKFHFFFLSRFHAVSFSDVSFYFIIYLHTGGLFDDDLDTQIAFRYAVKKTGEMSKDFDNYRKLNAGKLMGFLFFTISASWY